MSVGIPRAMLSRTGRPKPSAQEAWTVAWQSAYSASSSSSVAWVSRTIRLRPPSRAISASMSSAIQPSRPTTTSDARCHSWILSGDPPGIEDHPVVLARLNGSDSKDEGVGEGWDATRAGTDRSPRRVRSESGNGRADPGGQHRVVGDELSGDLVAQGDDPVGHGDDHSQGRGKVAAEARIAPFRVPHGEEVIYDHSHLRAACREPHDPRGRVPAPESARNEEEVGPSAARLSGGPDPTDREGQAQICEPCAAPKRRRQRGATHGSADGRRYRRRRRSPAAGASHRRLSRSTSTRRTSVSGLPPPSETAGQLSMSVRAVAVSTSSDTTRWMPVGW